MDPLRDKIIPGGNPKNKQQRKSGRTQASLFACFTGIFLFFCQRGRFFYVFLIAAQRFAFSFFLMEVPVSQSRPLELFQQCLQTVPDPRSKRGQGHVFRTVLPLIFLGIIANCTTPTGLQRWATIHLHTLRKFFRMRYYKGKYCAPHATTFTRILEKLSLADLQKAFAEFVNAIVADSRSSVPSMAKPPSR